MKLSNLIKMCAVFTFVLISSNTSFAQFGGGAGTQAEPYEIYTIEHLMELSDSVENSISSDPYYDWSRDKYFILMKNITDSVKFTIGCVKSDVDYTNCFQGDFNGNNKQITLALDGNQKLINGVWTNVWNYWIGLFSGIYLASVYDLNVNGYVKGISDIGGICGRASQSNISNCINRCNVENYELNTPEFFGNIGGICGYSGSYDKPCVIANCVNYGQITGYGIWIGGIVGSKGNIGITNCTNYGNIESYLNPGSLVGKDTYVGGICGMGGPDTGGVFLNCTNYGNITSQGAYAGGICGKVGYFLNCLNYGNVSGEQDGVGGICGLGGSDRNSDTNDVYLNCHNYGNVSGEHAVGGITGCLRITGNCISHCTNTGIITATSAVGGIAGHTHIGTKISHCINIGTVQGDGFIGGIAAGHDYSCFIGENESGAIHTCHNVGLVIGKYIVGGIQGYCHGGEIHNSLNTGVVIGNTNTGGIVGEVNETAIIQSCHYDKQMCIHGGITGQDIAGQAEGYLTKELIGNNLQAKLGNTDWTFDNANLYPTLKYFEKDSIAFVASSPVYLYDSDVSDFDRQNRVRTDFKVNLENNVKWNRIVGNVDIVNEDGVLRNSGSDTLVASIGNYKKLVPINIELLPIGDVKFTIWATEHKQIAPTETNYSIPIYVKADAKTLQEIVIKRMTVEIDKNVFYLKQVGDNTTWNRNQNEIVIENITIPTLNAGEEVVLFNIIGDMLLGTVDSSEIIINTNVEFVEDLATNTDTKNGYITLNICREGSDRFIEIAGNSPSLTIKNNPVEDILEVECNVLESGKYVLEVVDMTGRSVKAEEFVAGGAGAFQFEIDAKQFGIGSYILTMKTPSKTYSTMFKVVK